MTLLNVEVPTNDAEALSSQPLSFRRHLQLLPHQLKSLSWMESQERNRDNKILGGVLADKIGTGKTCIGLALMDKARCVEAIVPSSSRRLASKATLVIVPPNICAQWAREVEKFFQPGAQRVFSAEEASELKSWSVTDLASEADIIIVSYRIFASKSYGSRRRQLMNFDRDDLGEQGVTKFPVFEIFHFHRVIADEFHELVEAATTKKHPFREAMQALCNIQSTYRWGITSTPALKSVVDVVSMASFFHVNLRPTFEDVAEFVAKYVRKNSAEPARVSLIQRKVLIAQTIHERALYLLRRRQGAGSKDLLSYASVHWSWSAEHDDRTETRSAQEICKAKLQDLYRPIRLKEEKLKEAIVKIKLVQQTTSVQQLIGNDVESQLAQKDGGRKALESMAHFLEDGRLEYEITRNRRAGEKQLQAASVKGTAASVVSLVEGLAVDHTTAIFFENSLDESDSGVQCPVCLNQYCRAHCSIAKCGHKACSDCWSGVLKVDARCPICRDPVGDSLITLSAGIKMKPSQTSAIQEGTPFGSKVACLLETLDEVRVQEPSAKILVFCQFEELKVKVMDAFKKLGVAHLKLEGSTAHRTQIIEQFRSPEGPATLLLSMAISPSGLDLSVANHVIIMQPTWHDGSDDTSVDYEAQSVGRCWRMGQERPVVVHRLCMAGTVEESVVDRHLELWSAKFGALLQQ